MTAQLDYAYRVSREAMLDCLNTGFVDADGLLAMQAGMSNMNRTDTPSDRIGMTNCGGLLDEVEQRAGVRPA